jgi:hypothetical protein
MSRIRELIIAAVAIVSLAATNPAFSGPELSTQPTAEAGAASAVPTFTPTLW